MSSTKQVFIIYNLTQNIFIQLNDSMKIIRAQRVCRNWKEIIQTPSVLQDVCWYQPKDAQTWKLNPAFNQLGVSISEDIGDKFREVVEIQEKGQLSLEERIYDKPGSWTTMLATQPPCKYILFRCGDFCHSDEPATYLIISATDFLLMGDIMAILAECQIRQECAVDRYGGVLPYTAQLLRWSDDEFEDWAPYVLKSMANDMSINVAVSLPFGSGVLGVHVYVSTEGCKHMDCALACV